MTELYVDKKRLELGDINITQVYQINDVGEPKDRQLDYSFPIDIPETPSNLSALGMLGISNLSTTPYRVMKAKLVENGIEIISDGVLMITKRTTSGSESKLKAHIYGGNVFLFDEIGSKQLNEIDFTDLDHGVNATNFKDSFTNTSGYIYALSDFGKLDTTEIDVGYQIPSLFVHTIWKRIFDESGVKYYGDVFDSEKFKKKVITMHRGHNTEIDNLNNPVDINAVSEDRFANYFINTQTNTNPDVINFGLLLPDQNNVVRNEQPNDSTAFHASIISIISAGYYDLSFDIDLTVYNNQSTYTPYIEVIELINGGGSNVVYSFELSELVYQAAISESISESIYLKSDTDYIIKTVFRDFASLQSLEVDITQTVENFNLSNDQDLTLFLFSRYIGEMNQIAFVKDVMQEFGLISQKRKNEIGYDFIKIKDLINDRSNTVDWSDKLIGEVSEDFKPKSYAQSNIFDYQYLDDNGEKFAVGKLEIDNETLSTQKTLVVRPYNAASQSDKSIGGSKLTYTPFWSIEFNDDGSVKGYKPIQSRNYIAEIKNINTTIDYKSGNGATQQFTGSVPILDFSNLSYSQILNENYTELKNTLDFNKVKTVFMMLNELDIQNLDLFKTIYLKQYSNDFYINKLRYTNSQQPSKLEIVAIKRNVAQVGETIVEPEITIASTAFNEIEFGSFSWMISTSYNIKGINPINATITAKHFSDSPQNGGTETGNNEITDTLTQSNGTHNFLFPSNMHQNHRGWYEIVVEQDGVVSNKDYVNVNPI